MMRCTPSIILLGFVLSSSVVLAESKQTPVVVIPISFDDRPSARIGHFLEDALTKRPDITLNDVNSVLDRGTNRIHFDNIRQATVYLEKARAAFKESNYPVALMEFQRSVDLFEKSFSFLTTDQPFIDALVGLGFSNGLSGVQNEAITAFKKALIFNPHAKFDFTRYPKNLLRLFNKAKAELKNASLGELEIVTSPDNALVYVDGHFRGVSPVTVKRLQIGPHYVKISKLGYSSVNKIMVASSGTTKNDVALVPARRRFLLDQRIPQLRLDVADQKAGETMVGLKSLFFVEHVILVSIFGGSGKREVQLSLFDLKRRIRLKQVSAVVDWQTFDLTRAQAIVADLLKDVSLTGKAAVHPKHQQTIKYVGGKPVWKKWWFWTIIGAVVATGATVGIVLGTKKSGGERGFEKINGTGAVVLRF